MANLLLLFFPENEIQRRRPQAQTKVKKAAVGVFVCVQSSSKLVGGFGLRNSVNRKKVVKGGLRDGIGTTF